MTSTGIENPSRISLCNQAILPAIGGVTGRSLTLVPNPVTADTQVTLTLRDTGTAVPVTITGNGTGAAATAYAAPPLAEERRLRVRCNTAVTYARAGSHPLLENWTRANLAERPSLTPKQRREAVADARLLAYGGMG